MHMRQRILACSVGVVVMIGVLLPWKVSQAAGPQTWSLIPPVGRDYRKPDDTYRIFIPSTVSAGQLQQLSLELDGIDVTAMVNREGGYAVFKPPQALAWGKHQLRLVQYASDGSINELALWSFQVRKTALFREVSARGNVNLYIAHRISDHNQDNPSRRGSISGTTGLSAKVANGDWHSSADIQFVVNNQNQNSVAMSSFLLSGGTQQATLKLGQHSVDADSLVLGSFNRRGVSGTYLSRDQRYATTVFSMHTNSISGSLGGLGVSDPDNRTTGITVKAYPFSNAPGRLFLQGVYLQGKGTDSGSALYGSSLLSEGDAWSLAADSTFLKQRMRVRAEYAGTRYNFAGLNSGFPKESARAQSYLVKYTPWLDKVVDNQPLQWNVGVSRNIVGRFFHSIAEPNAPFGKKSTSVFTHFSWAAWRGNASIGREFDNVEDDPRMPTTRTDLFSLTTYYTPLSDPAAKPPAGLARLFAQPSYTITLGRTRGKYTRIPTGFTGAIVDNRTRSASLTAAFTPGNWNWSISRSYEQFDDNSHQQPDKRDNTTSFYSSILLGERVTGSVTLNWDVNQDPTSNIDTNTLTENLNLDITLVPNRLTGNLTYNMNHKYASDDTIDTRTATTTAGLTWTLQQARGNHPSEALYVNGNYTDSKDHVSPDASYVTYQVMVGINVVWAPTY